MPTSELKTGHKMQTEISDWIERISLDEGYREMIAVVTRLDPNDFDIAWKEFTLTKINIQDNLKWKSEKDIRKHFLNWIPSYKQRKNNDKSTTITGTRLTTDSINKFLSLPTDYGE